MVRQFDCLLQRLHPFWSDFPRRLLLCFGWQKVEKSDWITRWNGVKHLSESYIDLIMANWFLFLGKVRILFSAGLNENQIIRYSTVLLSWSNQLIKSRIQIFSYFPEISEFYPQTHWQCDIAGNIFPKDYVDMAFSIWFTTLLPQSIKLKIPFPDWNREIKE